MSEAYQKRTEASASNWQTQDDQDPGSFDSSENTKQAQPRRPAVYSAEGTSSPPPRPIWGRVKSQTTSQEQMEPQPPPQPADQTAFDGTDPFDDDSSSPTASTATARPPVPQSRETSQGSNAWDRLRKQAGAGATSWANGDRPSQETAWGRLRQDSATTQKDRSAPSNPEDNPYGESEKSRAQKDFDALLEAERRGQGDNGGFEQ